MGELHASNSTQSIHNANAIKEECSITPYEAASTFVCGDENLPPLPTSRMASGHCQSWKLPLPPCVWRGGGLVCDAAGVWKNRDSTQLKTSLTTEEPCSQKSSSKGQISINKIPRMEAQTATWNGALNCHWDAKPSSKEQNERPFPYK